MDEDPCVKAMYNETEEGMKVERAGTNKYYAVYERIVNDTERTLKITAENFFEMGQFGVSEGE
jgi:tRNA (guanine-N7-)-methyltransferase